MVPSHCLNQRWLFIIEVLGHSAVSDFTACTQATILYNEFDIILLNLCQISHGPMSSSFFGHHWFQLQWRHDGRNGVSNHQPHDCLLGRFFFRRRLKKTSKFRVTGLCGEFTVDPWFLAQRASNAENVSIWWHHHATHFVIQSSMVLTQGGLKTASILGNILNGFQSLQWHHNERDGVSNHQRFYCLLNCWFRGGSKKISKLRVTGLCAGNSSVTGEFPVQKASKAENVSNWWRHHGEKIFAVSLFNFIYSLFLCV